MLQNLEPVFTFVLFCAAPENEKSPIFNMPGVRRIGSEVSPGVFYGSPAGKPAHRPPQLLRLLNEIQNDLASQSTPSARYFVLMILACSYDVTRAS